MKAYYFKPEMDLGEELPALAFLQASKGQIQDYEEIPDTWD
jgi:hypothetical protein